MAAFSPPMAYGEKSPLQSPASAFNSLSTPPTLAKMLGYKWTVNGNEYKLVQASAAITAANLQSLVLIDNGATAKTHLTAGPVGANATLDTVAGIGAPNQIAVNAGDFFLVQTAGRATCFASSGSTTAHVQVVSAATGQVTTSAAISLGVAATILGIAHAAATSATVEVDLFPIA